MREIKFRAWDAGLNKNGKYWTWDLLLKHDLVREAFINKSIIVEQFTGLKDKNGKEIYEGDIINVCIVYNEVNPGIKRQFISSMQYFKYRGCYGFPEYHNMSLDDSRIDDEMISLEIIGNIHENPELLA